MTTYTEIIAELRTALSNGEELESIRDNSGEWIDGYLPICNNRIIEEWQDMPGEYDNRGAEELGIPGDISIISLMQLDLYLYYSDLFFQVLTDIAEELESVA